MTLALAKSWAEGEFGDLRPLIPHVEALLDSRIVDHNLDVGDPPNGWYVRYDSGLQKFFVFRTITGVTTIARGSVFAWTSPSNIPWPASAIRLLSVSPPIVHGAEYFGAGFHTLGATEYRPVFWSYDARNNETRRFSVIASSLWKEMS